MFSIWTFLVFGYFVQSQGSLCPEVFRKVKERLGGCEAIQCESGLVPSKCPSGTVYEEKATFCDCCPGCVKYESGFLDKCGPSSNFDESNYIADDCNEGYCAIPRGCKPGLQCAEYSDSNDPTVVHRCLPDPDTDTKDCKNTCFIKKSIIEYQNEVYEGSGSPKRHLPSCTPDGKYNPKQCKGTKNEGECFCVDDCGKRIFGRQLYNEADKMACGCSRLVHDLRKNKGRMATFHCKENGDFEPLQCDSDSGLCYCVDEITGRTTGEVLPEHQFNLLPCFNGSSDEFSSGGRYLRVCESEWVAAEKISREGKLHGMTFNHRPLECDYDGGFSPTFRDTSVGQERCVHRSGMPLASYFRQYTEDSVMDCQCARDSVFYPLHNIPFLTECEREVTPGSYKTFYTNGDHAYCVDLDGYQFGPNVHENLTCCLEEEEGCKNPNDCILQNSKFSFCPCSYYVMGRDDDVSEIDIGKYTSDCVTLP